MAERKAHGRNEPIAANYMPFSFVSELDLTGVSRRFNLVMPAETGCQQLFLDMIISAGSPRKLYDEEEKGNGSSRRRSGPREGLEGAATTKDIISKHNVQPTDHREITQEWVLKGTVWRIQGIH